MMNKKKSLLFVLILGVLASQEILAQNNSLSSSPYSLSGLGILNQVSTGKTNALGKAGIAMKSSTSINNLNPASYAGIPLHSFFFDVGGKAQFDTYETAGNKENSSSANFSNISFAFPVNDKSGIGLTLTPYSSVGYNIDGIETDIEGSNNSFSTIVEGTGGLKDLKLSYGYNILPNLSIGSYASVLFGKIQQTETNVINQNLLVVEDDNYYRGFKFGFGTQYELNENFSFGAIVNLPVRLSGDQETSITQLYDDQIEVSTELDDFKLPLEVGFGLQTKLNDNLYAYADYKHSFWDETDQEDYIGKYTDQDFFGLGVEYIPNENSLKYWEHIEYRAGVSYDNGNILVNDEETVDNYALSLGIGLPLRSTKHSMINISYSYGQKGKISNSLIKENYHLISVNLSFEGIWFVKRKLN
ncbi:Long-chain fatty acid transport protein [Mesonia phycicola]|uniref:Long-chain fatty acid transport protein n=1 Tax=Mesonia phycicola TaxID=579105 RepID=A0A1M6C099_9FLAO|nr:hypothetical protein [Mesonia phycicola]SHI54489.1 Long-chain fatty acid transport protein [Mesonia phycicola]